MRRMDLSEQRRIRLCPPAFERTDAANAIRLHRRDDFWQAPETTADAVLDRLVHSAHRQEPKDEALRKPRAAKNAKLDEAITN